MGKIINFVVQVISQNGTPSGLKVMVSSLDSGSNGPGSSTGCVVFLSKTLSVPLSTQELV